MQKQIPIVLRNHPYQNGGLHYDLSSRWNRGFENNDFRARLMVTGLRAKMSRMKKPGFEIFWNLLGCLAFSLLICGLMLWGARGIMGV